MEPVDILKKIIKTNGSCDFAKPSICVKCPLAQLRTTERGMFMGCIEAIGVVGLSNQEADAKYLAAAQKKLLDIEMDLMLEVPEDDIK